MRRRRWKQLEDNAGHGAHILVINCNWPVILIMIHGHGLIIFYGFNNQQIEKSFHQTVMCKSEREFTVKKSGKSSFMCLNLEPDTVSYNSFIVVNVI